MKAYAHIHVDQRWIQLPTKLTETFLQNASGVFRENVKSPSIGAQSQSIQSACIFVSQQEPCSIPELVGGVLVNFELG